MRKFCSNSVERKARSIDDGGFREFEHDYIEAGIHNDTIFKQNYTEGKHCYFIIMKFIA